MYVVILVLINISYQHKSEIVRFTFFGRNKSQEINYQAKNDVKTSYKKERMRGYWKFYAIKRIQPNFLSLAAQILS